MDLLVKKVTTDPKNGDVLILEANLISAVKQACKRSDDSTKEVFYYASMDLKKRSGVVRIRSLLLMDCLIHRSKVFRELVCSDIKQIAKCMGLLQGQDVGGNSKAQNSERYVAPVTSFAVELESKGKELIEMWDHLYGDRHPQLRAIARYFRESLRLEMPNILENAAFHAERAERGRRHKENLLLLTKDKIIHNEWRNSIKEWETSLARLEECFNILFPRIGDSGLSNGTEAQGEADDVDWVGGDGDSDLESDLIEEAHQPAGSSSSASGVTPYTLTIQLSTAARDVETADNAVLLHTIRELSRVLARFAVPHLLHWQDIFAQSDTLYTQKITVETAKDRETETENEVPVHSSLGKRAASDPTSLEGLSTVFVSPTTARLQESQQEVRQCSVQVSSLLGAIRSMLTGKCKDLLKDEII